MRAYRDRLRAQGLRPVQVWVPDTERSGFAAEARRQSLLVRDDPHESKVLAEIERAADLHDWKP